MLKLISGIICFLPTLWMQSLGKGLGELVFCLFRIRRKVAIKNLQQALHLPWRQSVALGHKVYRHLGMGALEFMQMKKLAPRVAEKLLDDEALIKVRRILERGKGLLVLSAHLGNWDLLACSAALCGLKVNVVTREIKAQWINRFWLEQRRALGVHLLPAQGSARQIIHALKRNEIVAVVLDQHDPQGMVVPFFKRPARTSTILARLARLTGSPVIPAFLLRQDEQFKLIIEEPLELKATPDKHADILTYTTLFNEIIERQVRSTPDQWLWLHRRWKPIPASQACT